MMRRLVCDASAAPSGSAGSEYSSRCANRRPPKLAHGLLFSVDGWTFITKCTHVSVMTPPPKESICEPAQRRIQSRATNTEGRGSVHGRTLMSNTARSLLSSVRIVRMISPSIVLTANRSPQPMNMLTPLLDENMIDFSGSWTCEKRNSQRPGTLHDGLRAVE